MQPIRNLQQLDVLFVKSNDMPVLLFKHSTQCGTSADAWDELQKFSRTADASGLVIAYVHVIEDRPVSNAVAEKTGVKHESPQALFIKKGDVVWHASHGAITSASLQQAAA